MKRRTCALLLALALLLSACGPEAASMFLRKTEGQVAVTDGEGSNVQLREDLGLYSGCGVDTRSASYAWIELDRVKLAKMDERSEISIENSGKKLKIAVRSGSVFFDVTEPLAEDEAMEIETATLLVGIRGTCGWVDAGRAQVGLLRGEVVCGETAVAAGEIAAADGDGGVSVRKMTLEDVPQFVRDEVDEAALPPRAKRLVRSFYHVAARPENDQRTDYTYDQQGLLVRSDEYTLADGALSIYTLYTCDSRGQVLRWETYDAGGALLNTMENRYDAQDQLTESFYYNAEGELRGHYLYGGGGAPRGDDAGVYEIRTHEYDGQGRIIRENIYRQGRLDCYQDYEYDEDGRAARTTVYAASEDGGFPLHSTSVSTYDEDGNQTRLDFYQADGTLEYYSTYEYE